MTSHQILLYGCMFALTATGILWVLRPLMSYQRLRVACFTIAGLCLGLYALVGRHDLEAQPYRAYQQSLDNKLRQEHSISRADMEETTILLEQRLRSDPSDSRQWILLGRSWSLLGQPFEALFAFERGLAHHPKEDSLRKEYARALAFSGNPQALSIFADLLAIKPNDIDILWSAATFATNLQRYDLALNYWQSLANLLESDSAEREAVNTLIKNLQANR